MDEKITTLTELNETPADDDVFPFTDISDTTQSANGTTKKNSWANLVKNYVSNQTWILPPRGYLVNGKIVPSVASNNLTVALKGLDGNDPSATNPVSVRIGDTIHTITSALSVTINAGTNSFNAGSAALATKEIDYFVYLGYNATDGVVIGTSRFPGANEYDDFSATATNEKYCAISTITNAAAGDDYELIGRFAATLSAGAGYTWTVPTFNNKNLIQRPIYETRELSCVAGETGFTAAINTVYKYQIIGEKIFLEADRLGNGTSNATTFTFTLPFSPKNSLTGGLHCFIKDNGTLFTTVGYIALSASSTTSSIYKEFFEGVFTSSGTKAAYLSPFNYEI